MNRLTTPLIAAAALTGTGLIAQNKDARELGMNILEQFTVGGTVELDSHARANALARREKLNMTDGYTIELKNVIAEDLKVNLQDAMFKMKGLDSMNQSTAGNAIWLEKVRSYTDYCNKLGIVDMFDSGLRSDVNQFEVTYDNLGKKTNW